MSWAPTLPLACGGIQTVKQKDSRGDKEHSGQEVFQRGNSDKQRGVDSKPPYLYGEHLTTIAFHCGFSGFSYNKYPNNEKALQEQRC